MKNQYSVVCHKFLTPVDLGIYATREDAQAIAGDCPQCYIFEDKVTIAADVGGTKNDQEKPQLELIPYSALQAEAQALAYGVSKYGRHNYKKGFEYSRLISAALRHIHAFNEGENYDEESRLHHLGHARACLAFLIDQMAAGTGTDDRYVKN